MSRSLRFLVPILTLTAALGFGLRATAQDRPPQREEPATPLQEAMGELQGGMKALRPLVEQPEANREKLLEVAHSMQAAALKAIQNPPALPAGFPEEGGFMWRIGFQRKVLALADALFELELAIHRGKVEEMRAAIEKAGALKDEGHDTYQ